MFLKYAQNDSTERGDCSGCGALGAGTYATTETSGIWCKACTEGIIQAHLHAGGFDAEENVQDQKAGSG